MNNCHIFLDLHINPQHINMADRKVIHLHIDGEDYYFGSVSAIYSTFSKEQIGIGYGALRNFGISTNHPYSNGKVIIKEGMWIPSKGERGKKTED